jgi:hypothetical protein
MTSVGDQLANFETCRRLAEVGAGHALGRARPMAAFGPPAAGRWQGIKQACSRLVAGTRGPASRRADGGAGRQAGRMRDASIHAPTPQEAVRRGCRMLFLPECFSFIGSSQPEVRRRGGGRRSGFARGLKRHLLPQQPIKGVALRLPARDPRLRPCRCIPTSLAPLTPLLATTGVLRCAC